MAGPALADHDGAAHSPGDPDRRFELVSPPDKLGGAGVGIPTSTLIGRALGAGTAAYVGERFAVSAHLGTTLLDAEFATANDWAFAERVSQQAGWRSHSPVTHPFRCPENYRMQQMQQAAPDFSTVIWNSNGGDLPFFEQMCDPAFSGISNGTSLVSDWGNPPQSPTRWEPIAPLTPAQALPVSTGQTDIAAPAVSADGSRLAVSGPFRGLAGDDDPTWDTVGADAHSAYVVDMSAGLADSWPGASVRIPAASCTGSGLERTRVPARDAGGEIDAVACERPLVSDFGSTITWQALNPIGTSNTNVISADGSRTFVMAPDPSGLSIFDYAGYQNCTSDTGLATKCPTQLYVRQESADGEVVTRWVSRPEQGQLNAGFAASLLGPAYFEGASVDGGRVFFRTASPLTADDPSGACGAPCTSGARDPNSWDLYMLELAPGPDGDPATPDGDPMGPGSELTRISRGPAGSSDCGVQPGGVGAALRFSADDGGRVYFSCAAPLGGVADRATGTAAGTQAGDPSTTGQSNVYMYDVSLDRYTFVARIPRSTGTSTGVERVTRCSSAGALRGMPGNSSVGSNANVNCWRGSGDGALAVFFTLGRLTGDDPDELSPDPSADIYAYDAEGDELVRVSAPRGAVDETYECLPGNGPFGCYGDLGHASGKDQSVGNPLLNVATDSVSGERSVFFESGSRLVDGDENGVYDVYRWREGELSLVSSGAAGSKGSAYKGNSADGRNVYLMTADALTWQDFDAVADIYTARLGGGIVEPPPPAAVCAVLADGCQGAEGAAPVAPVVPRTTSPGAGGNAEVVERGRVAVRRPSRRARLRAARRGVLAVRVRSSRAGLVRVVARARVGRRRASRVGGASRRLAKAGSAVVRVRLSRAARRRLRAGRPLRVRVVVRAPGALAGSVVLVLRRAGR